MLKLRLDIMKTRWDHPRTWLFNEVCMLINLGVCFFVIFYGLFVHAGPFWSYDPDAYPVVHWVMNSFLVYFSIWLFVDLFFPVHHRGTVDLPLLLHHGFAWMFCATCLFTTGLRHDLLLFFFIGLLNQESFVYFALRRGSRNFRLYFDIARIFYFGTVFGYFFPHMEQSGRSPWYASLMMFSVAAINMFAFKGTNAIFWSSKYPSGLDPQEAQPQADDTRRGAAAGAR